MSFTKQTHNILIVALTFFNFAILKSSEQLNQYLRVAAYFGQLEKVKNLITQGADVNVKNKAGCTGLMYAAHKGYTDVVKYLTEHGADVNAKNKSTCTALMCAADQGHTEVVRYLIEHGADITTINELTARVKKEQKELDASSSQYKAYEAVHNYLEKISVIQHYLKDALVEEQITQEPDLDQYMSNYSQIKANGEFSRPLIERFRIDRYAYWKGRVREAIHPLREQNVHPLRNLLTEINPGLLPLIISYFKSRKIFKNLITEELLPTATEPQRTRLQQIVQIEERVESEIKNRAKDHYKVEQETIVQRMACQPEQLNRNLIMAAYNGLLEKVKDLIIHGTDVNIKNNNNSTALMSAAYQGHVGVVKYLAQHGADVNAKDHKNCTALMFAVDKGHADVVRYLIEHGADTTTINELTARVRRKQAELNASSAQYKTYETVHNYLEKISITQMIKEEMTCQQKEQIRAKTFERHCCSIS